jgi:hypothetical protein
MLVNKPGCVPVHATTSNHTQGIISKLKRSHPNLHISVPQRVSRGIWKLHFVDPKSPAPKQFVVPKHSNHEWKLCQLKIKQLGDDSFCAVCVSNTYHDKIDSCLAHYLWGPHSNDPKTLGIQYVVELQVELLTYQTYQLRGQLAAMGCPIVGDALYGGGTCDAYDREHHEWNRMAAQCGSSTFQLPMFDDKKHLVTSEGKCECVLENAWWSRYLQQYESYHQLQKEATA